MLARCFVASLVAPVVSAANAIPVSRELAGQSLVSSNAGNPPCAALEAAGLRDRLLVPTDAAYEPQINTWWAANTRLRPWCLVLPQTVDEVSLILKTLSNAGEGAGDWHIAIRSGSHSTTGGNNIVNGVAIDLSHMNSTEYDEASSLARVYTGARWESVYSHLAGVNRSVVGGRDGTVGVGGFLLGGGYSFYSPKLGFGCDSVVNYEVVLGNGTIVQANESAHSDLYRALKGGHSNFGLVTRFDMATIPARNLWYELRYLANNYSSVVADVAADFANHDESLGDNALVTWVSFNSTISPVTTASTIYVNVEGNPHVETSYDAIRRLPSLLSESVSLPLTQAAAASGSGEGTWSTGSSGTYKNNPAILRNTIRVHEDLARNLTSAIGVDSFSTFFFMQPLPSYMGSIGKQRGGNVLGLDSLRDNAIIWTAGVSVSSNEADFALARALLQEASAQIQAFAASEDGVVDFIYLNYAGAEQDPLGSYGAEQVEFMRDVAARYDPAGVFQRRVPGGFKISRVV
ncbi:hypothetical protein B0I35DRAFT_513840 [Stachybotrys elegans]|uniref:FAD-binding PCMH-type domain-containing protein n=1 Tax=Stachybotrys elegans TaxID=80388 RepID=A0A8K0SQZ4_9HYPO|nr:hypothetical protein B0I35DRAFT_513840 [Stachybotrys elegans]